MWEVRLDGIGAIAYSPCSTGTKGVEARITMGLFLQFVSFVGVALLAIIIVIAILALTGHFSADFKSPV